MVTIDDELNYAPEGAVPPIRPVAPGPAIAPRPANRAWRRPAGPRRRRGTGPAAPRPATQDPLIEIVPPFPPGPTESQIEANAMPQDFHIPAPVAFAAGVAFTMIILFIVLASSRASKDRLRTALDGGSATQQRADTGAAAEDSALTPAGWTYAVVAEPIPVLDAEGYTLGVLPKGAHAFFSWRTTVPSGDVRTVVAEDGSFWGYARTAPVELLRTPLRPECRNAVAVILRLEAARNGYRNSPPVPSSTTTDTQSLPAGRSTSDGPKARENTRLAPRAPAAQTFARLSSGGDRKNH